MTKDPHDTHKFGIYGEWAYGLLTGTKPDLTLRINGAAEPDFPDVEVKTTSYFEDPWLRLWPKEILRAKAYVLCALDERNKRVWVVGWATAEEVEAAPLRFIRTKEGSGFRRVLKGRTLRPIATLV